MGDIFKSKLNRKPAASRPVTVLTTRPCRSTDVTRLAEIERESYHRYQVDANGKFTSVTKPVVDPDFDVELYPLFLIGEDGLTALLENKDKALRVNVVDSRTQAGSTPVSAFVYKANQVAREIEILWMVLDPKGPAACLTKMFDWVTSIVEGSLKEYTIVYDYPESFDTPSKRIFDYLMANGWAERQVKDVYRGNVNSRRFTLVVGGDGEENGGKKKKKVT